MVQTRSSCRAAPKTLPETGDEEDHTSDYDVPPRPKKRKAACVSRVSASAVKKGDKGKGKARGRTGKLALILDVPTEIVLEILSYLTPTDVLNLSFVDKELRARLTSPSSAPVWAAARRNVPDLPDCPVDFTEWGYARFLFLNRCELCSGIAHGLPEMFYIRIRLCSRCDKEQVVNLVDCQLTESEHELIPRAVKRCGRYPEVVFKPAVDHLCHRLAQLRDRKEELEEFTKDRLELVAEVMEHGQEVSDWLQETQTAASRERAAIWLKRVPEIFARLEARGYERRDIRCENVLQHRVVRQPVQLTDKLWPTVLRHLGPIVEANRQQRLGTDYPGLIQAHLRTRFFSLWHSLPSTFDKFTYIPVLDFMELPAIQTVIDASIDLNLSGFDAKQVDTCFNAHLPTINQEIEQFRARMRKDLCLIWARYNSDRLSPMSVRGADDATILQRLCLATTVFQASRRLAPGCPCIQPIHYPTLFKHSLHGNSCIWTSSWCADNQPALQEKWNHYRVRLTSTRAFYLRMCTVVNEAGLDTETSTIDELEARGLYHPTRQGPSAAASSGAPSPPVTWIDEYIRSNANDSDDSDDFDDSDVSSDSDISDDSDVSSDSDISDDSDESSDSELFDSELFDDFDASDIDFLDFLDELYSEVHG